MKKVLVVGSEGSQGKRYRAILDWLNVKYACRDVCVDEIHKDTDIYEDISHILITTPTDTHCEQIKKYLPYQKPILVEKPITKNLIQLEQVLDAVMTLGVEISMVHQYRHLLKSQVKGADSHYNYFKHGNDGLIWDCLQIINLATGAVQLSEHSPIWMCRINGEPLKIQQMDFAYITEITQWLNGYRDSLDTLYKIHEKVASFEVAHNG
jgi:hypothetical protein